MFCASQLIVFAFLLTCEGCNGVERMWILGGSLGEKDSLFHQSFRLLDVRYQWIREKIPYGGRQYHTGLKYGTRSSDRLPFPSKIENPKKIAKIFLCFLLPLLLIRIGWQLTMIDDRT